MSISKTKLTFEVLSETLALQKGLIFFNIQGFPPFVAPHLTVRHLPGRYVTVAGIIAGLSAVVLGAIGFVGQMAKSPTRICVYSLGAAPSALQKRCGSDHGRDKHGAFAKSLVLLIVAIWRLIYAFTSVPLLDAAVDQQITEWCLPENRPLYYSKLECPVSRSGCVYHLQAHPNRGCAIITIHDHP
eukprot:g18088.t1